MQDNTHSRALSEIEAANKSIMMMMLLLAMSQEPLSENDAEAVGASIGKISLAVEHIRSLRSCAPMVTIRVNDDGSLSVDDGLGRHARLLFDLALEGLIIDPATEEIIGTKAGELEDAKAAMEALRATIDGKASPTVT